MVPPPPHIEPPYATGEEDPIDIFLMFVTIIALIAVFCFTVNDRK